MQGLKQWVEAFPPAKCTADEPLQLTSIAGDAGFRAYFRVNASPPVIAVLAPPEHANNEAFIRKQGSFREAGVHVPRVHAVNFERGYMLQEDLGDQLLLNSLTADRVEHLYGVAEQVLLQIQQMPLDREVFSAYSQRDLLNEMTLFPKWFLGDLLGIQLSEQERELLETTFRQLIDTALEQPEVVVHRDFHSRNLMLLKGEADHSVADIGVIDFQDAVTGPITYDLVSLLRDCYIRWPADYVSQRVADYRQRLAELGLITDEVGVTEFSRWFDLMGLQRHIKVLGIFSRLHLRDGKPQYLDDLPLVFRYTMEQAGKYPELSAFVDWLGSKVVPLLPKQPWYRPWENAGEK